MAVTHTPIGYAGLVNELGETSRFGPVAVPFKTGGVNAWAVTSLTTSNLSVSIAAGTAQCYGVADTTTAVDTVVLAANGGAFNRYDAIVARWTWGTTPSVAFAALTGTVGGATPPTPTRNRGVVYEAILAVVLVSPGMGAVPPANIYDVHPWGGVAGPIIIPQLGFYTSVDLPTGAEVAIGSPRGDRYIQTDGGLARAGSAVAAEVLAGAVLGAPWANSGTLWHDLGSTVVTTGAGGSVQFALPRTYSGGIVTADFSMGDYSAACTTVIPILANMTGLNVFNGVGLSGSSAAVSGTQIRVNFDVWGWTTT